MNCGCETHLLSVHCWKRNKLRTLTKDEVILRVYIAFRNLLGSTPVLNVLCKRNKLKNSESGEVTNSCGSQEGGKTIDLERNQNEEPVCGGWQQLIDFHTQKHSRYFLH